MKRLFAILISLCLLLSAFALVACEPKEKEQPDDKQQSEQTPDEVVPGSDVDASGDDCNAEPEDPLEQVDYKPVIYLYPEKDTVCSVTMELNGRFTCTYPDYGTAGWQNFVASPDGTLTFPDGKEYYCLYWEGVTAKELDLSRGACVRGEDTAAYLEWALAEMGLTAREANEFIIYWLPQLQENEYNLISFQGKAYTDAAKLNVTPAPDSVLRVYMLAKPLTAPVEVEPQSFAPFEREGFTVVEWGGSILK
jgi:hypothetical protein